MISFFKFVDTKLTKKTIKKPIFAEKFIFSIQFGVMKQVLFVFILGILILLQGCNTSKYVPDGEYLLDKVTIKTDNKDISKLELKEYLRQTPNAAVFGVFRMQLGIYNMAGKDTTKWLNRFWRKIGDPPVIYNSSLTTLSTQQLQLQLQNKGYINAIVQNNVKFIGKKAQISYIINSNKPYKIRDYKVDLKNNLLNEISNDTSKSLVHPEMLFDVDVLNAERERISTKFRQEGYYNFNKEFLAYVADSTLNTHKVDLSLELKDNLNRPIDSVEKILFRKYKIRNVIFYTSPDANVTTNQESKEILDTLIFRNFILVTPKKPIIKLDALVQNTFINPNTTYSDEAVERTYSSLNSLGPIKYVNISFKELPNDLLDCYIIVIPSKTISFSVEAEGTYTEGYWGGATKLNFLNKNVFGGAETLTAQGRYSFEKQDAVWATELGGLVGLKFPQFIFPFVNYDFKRSIHANTEVNTQFTYQIRPNEFSSTNAGAGIKYTWHRNQFQHSIDLIDLSIVNFNVDPVFTQTYLNTGLFNKYNYTSHLIMRTGYSGSYSTFNPYRPLRDYSTVRYSIQTAGNLLNGLTHLFNSKPDSTGAYQIFNIRYSQYVKGEYNITHHQIFNKENRFVYHFGLGIGVPYGNGEVIPYENRFFSGGANSVRGWNESSLGPGIYKRITSNSLRDFNQVGDIKLDMNLEYRAKLFWVLEGALFLDAGNIWTIKPYDTQPGGEFKFDTFLNQIAIAYGAGARFDFSYFLIRFDLGVRLFDPVLSRRDQWRISPGANDFVFHIAIGYPF